MKKWEFVDAAPCLYGHLIVATRNGAWSNLCQARPERWETIQGEATDEPLIYPNSDKPTCEVCAMLLERNAAENLTKDNWPIEWKPVKS